MARRRADAEAREVVIFNRSHYEDVIVVRVHNFVPKSIWSQRYVRHYDEFERLMVELIGILPPLDAGLGRKTEPMREARQACDLKPFATAAVEAPIIHSNLAVAYAWTGKNDLALAELETLIGKAAGSNLPAQATYGDLRLNPIWDPLRKNPRFAKIVDRLAPAASR